MRRFLFVLALVWPWLLKADFEILVPVSYYGWLNQYSMDTKHSFVGNEACVPTSSVNAMTYLQNSSPSIFGTSLSGSSYSDWEYADSALISIMGTTSPGGTEYQQFVWTYQMHIALTKGFSQVQFSGMFPDSVWDGALGYPKPDYIISGMVTPQVLTNALGAGSAALVSIEYLAGGGHELLVNGLEWDPVEQKGTLYFVDPLDPSENYSGSTVLGPTKQTSGVLELNASNELILTYNQYSGRLPYTGTYAIATAKLVGLLSVGGFFYAPYFEGSGNAVSLYYAIKTLDPTTSSMFPILAALNTTADLEGALLELDPSVYNASIFATQMTALTMRFLISQNLLRYHNPCCCQCYCNGLWVAPFYARNSQGGIGHSGYKSHAGGVTVGYDRHVDWDAVLGVSAYYAHDKVNWKHIDAKSRLNQYGLSLYGLKFWDQVSLEGSVSGFYASIVGEKDVKIASQIPFIPSVEKDVRNDNHAHTYLGQFRVIYDAYCINEAVLWPYVNFDYLYTRQSGFREKGGDPINLKVKSKGTSLARSEVGVGSSWCLPCTFSLDFLLSYVNESRWSGKQTIARFEVGSNEFTVNGKLPQNNLVATSLILRSSQSSQSVDFQLAYHGEFGVHLIQHEFTGQLSFNF